MSDKKYKITTVNKKFLSDTLGGPYLKKEGNTFFARENLFDKWEKLIQLEKQTSALDWWDNNRTVFGIISWVLFIIVAIAYGQSLVEEVGSWVRIFVIFFHPAVWWLLCLLVDELIRYVLKDSSPYYVGLSNYKIEKLIERNKPRPSSTSHTSSGYRSSDGYRSGGSSGGRSYSGGGYSGGSGSASHSTSNTYVSSTDMDNALKTMKDKGLDWKTLANDKTDEEREKLFIEHFGDEEKGKIASDRFNQTDIYPARKDHLNKLINEGEFEDNSIKTNLLDKVKSFNEAISKDEFESIVHEIGTFKERKKRIDNHVKYEGRLSNKDIQAIKEHLGYICMACGLNPAEEYGENMKGIMEAHHKKPYAEIEDGESRTVEPDDFLILCPTCHRLIHKLGAPDDLDGLKELVNKPTYSSWWD